MRRSALFRLTVLVVPLIALALGPLGTAWASPLSTNVVPDHASIVVDANGYWLGASDGGIFRYGATTFDGSHGAAPLNQPIVGMAAAADGAGYWLVARDGGVFGYGDARFHGSHGGSPLNQPIVGMASTPDGQGYWLVASDGGIFGYGAHFYGSHGGSPLNQPIVGMAATPDGGGYWMVARDGGVFGYGDAHFYGSHGGSPLNQPIVGMSATPDGAGYWLVARDGGVFGYGDAHFYGSHGGSPLNQPIVGMAATPDGAGYWLVARDGGVFGYGGAHFYGSHGGSPLNQPIVGMAPLPLGHGFWGQDDCHRYLQNGQWISDLCMRFAVGANGPDPHLLNFYRYAGAGQPLTEVDYQVDISDPTYFTFRVEILPAVFSVIAWIRVSLTDPSAPAQYQLCTQAPLYGTCAWFTLAQIESESALGNAPAWSNTFGSLPSFPFINDAGIAAGNLVSGATLGAFGIVSGGGESCAYRQCATLEPDGSTQLHLRAAGPPTERRAAPSDAALTSPGGERTP